jgi:predicted dehydrogenase
VGETTQPRLGPPARGSGAELRVGVVGFGWMGQVHSRAYTRLAQHYPDVPLRPRLVAVAEVEPSRQRLAVTTYAFERAVDGWEEVVGADDVDAVSVCGPNFLHRDISVAAAQAGKHVWVEKPAGRHLADTAEIAQAVAGSGVQCAVGFNYRNAPAVELARTLVAEGRLGGIQTASVRFLSDYAAHPDGALSWRFDPSLAGTGVLGDLASHGLDLMRYVLGASGGDVVEVVGEQATFIARRPEPTNGAVSHFATAAGGRLGPVGNEDHVLAMLRFATGVRGVLESSRVAVGEQCAYGFEVRGERGAVAWDFRRMGVLSTCLGEEYQDAAWQERYVGPGVGEVGAFQPGAGVAMGYDDLKVIEAERFVRSVSLGEPVGATIEDALVAARFVEAVTRSIEERRWVAM